MTVKVKETQSCTTLCHPMHYTVHGILQAGIQEWVDLPRGSSQTRDRTQVSCTVDGLFTIGPQGKPQNTGLGSLSLLRQMFLIQESNWGLLHCRRILYQLSYQENPSLSVHLTPFSHLQHQIIDNDMEYTQFSDPSFSYLFKSSWINFLLSVDFFGLPWWLRG